VVNLELRLNSVCAVVVTYNRLNLLEQVLKSLLAQSRPIDQIYVVDNASTDTTRDFLSAQDNPRISWKRLPTNTGGAGGFSYGMKWAFDEGHEWIWVMDDDLEPVPDCLEMLLSEATDSSSRPEPNLPHKGTPYPSGPRALIPLRMTRAGKVAEWAAQHINLSRPFVRAFRLGLIRESYPDANALPPTIRVEDFSFEGPLFHRSVPAKIGFPKSALFIYTDDTEYALRIQRSGLGTPICVSKARAVRMVDEPAWGSSAPSWRDYYGWRNFLILQSGYATNAVMVVRPYLFFIASTVKRIIKGHATRRELAMRWHSLLDSTRRPLICRYLP
jgi:GT2 family glycosyltransferase